MNNFLKKSLDFWVVLCYIYTMMNEENIYKVTMIDGPTTAILPIKARDASHAVRIASNLELNMRIESVTLACERSDS